MSSTEEMPIIAHDQLEEASDGGGYTQMVNENEGDSKQEKQEQPKGVSRTAEEKEVLKKKLEKFYAEYNPSMLEGGHIESIVNSNTPDGVLFRRLFEKYVHDDSEDDYEEHPQIVDEGKQQRKVFKERKVKPKGGHTLARKFSDYTMALLIPVSMTMIIVVWAVTNFTPISKVSDASQGGLLLPVATENKNDSSSEKFSGAVLNSIVIVGFFILVTSIMVVLYKYNCMKIIAGWLITSSAMILYVMGWIWFDLFCTKYQIPYDAISCFIILLNFGTVGVICIYFRGHPKMTQAYLVATSSIMAWFLTRIPEWTTWVLLAAVALYDVFSVLCPKGPLKALVEESQKRDQAIPGLIYESKSYKLGLGDFVFYSVLVGRAAVYDYLPWVVCFLAVLTGLCATLICLGIFRKALPALPISIALGIIFNFSTRYVLLPYDIRYTNIRI